MLFALDAKTYCRRADRGSTLRKVARAIAAPSFAFYAGYDLRVRLLLAFSEYLALIQSETWLASRSEPDQAEQDRHRAIVASNQ